MDIVKKSNQINSKVKNRQEKQLNINNYVIIINICFPDIHCDKMTKYRLFSLRSATVQLLGDESFYSRDSFSPGLLPTGREVIEMMVHLLMPRGKGHHQNSKQEAALMTAGLLSEHWLWCNVYPKHLKNITASVLKL